MKVIESADNKIIKKAASLHTKKYRDQLGLYLVEGENLVAEALSQGLAEQVLVRDDYDREIPKGDAEFLFIKGKLFPKLALTENSQGILALVRKPNLAPADFAGAKPGTNLVVLDSLQDPGNVGTILRTAAAAGYAGALVLKGTTDIYGPKTVRAAAGAIFRLPCLLVDTAAEAVDLLHGWGKTVIGTAVTGAVPYEQVDMTEDIALIIGNEGNGMRQELLDAADVNVTIPMAHDMESLNAAVAAGILMYHKESRKG